MADDEIRRLYAHGEREDHDDIHSAIPCTHTDGNRDRGGEENSPSVHANGDMGRGTCRIDNSRFDDDPPAYGDASNSGGTVKASKSMTQWTRR